MSKELYQLGSSLPSNDELLKEINHRRMILEHLETLPYGTKSTVANTCNISYSHMWRLLSLRDLQINDPKVAAIESEVNKLLAKQRERGF